MKTREDFEAFHKVHISPLMDVYWAGKRVVDDDYSFQKYGRNMLLLGIVCVGITFCVFIHVLPLWMGPAIGIFVLYAIIAPLVIGFQRRNDYEPLVKTYKRSCLAQIASFLDPPFTYHSDAGISKAEFNSSGLEWKPDKFNATDLASGKVGQNEVRMSLFTWDDSDRKFEGFYAIIHVSKNYSSKILVWEKGYRRNQIKFDSEQANEFEKHFTVEALLSEVAKSALTPEVLKLLVSLKKDQGFHPEVAFFDNEVHICFGQSNLFSTLSMDEVPYDPLNYFRLVSAVISMAEIL